MPVCVLRYLLPVTVETVTNTLCLDGAVIVGVSCHAAVMSGTRLACVRFGR